MQNHVTLLVVIFTYLPYLLTYLLYGLMYSYNSSLTSESPHPFTNVAFIRAEMLDVHSMCFGYIELS